MERLSTTFVTHTKVSQCLSCSYLDASVYFCAGRGILILRNPYDAVLSKLNYLYGGHRGASSIEQFERLEIFKFQPIFKKFLCSGRTGRSLSRLRSPTGFHLLWAGAWQVREGKKRLLVLKIFNFPQRQLISYMWFTMNKYEKIQWKKWKKLSIFSTLKKIREDWNVC